MHVENIGIVVLERVELASVSLNRLVTLDFYQAGELSVDARLLLINDGQDLQKMGMSEMLGELYSRGDIGPALCVGIHAGPQRLMEYGTAAMPDYAGRGRLAGAYTRFVLEELLPVIEERFGASAFRDKAFAGFSLGALSAMDMVWAYPEVFSTAGLFSGSFWWRKKDKDDPGYQEQRDRIMHQLVSEGVYHPGQRFFFECGTEDESEDRNGNGVIDSIDDVRDLIGRLEEKGYESGKDIRYIEIEGGRHEVETWRWAMPEFLRWVYGKKKGS